MIFWISAAIALPAVIAALLLLGVWIFHFHSAVKVCETIATLGTGAAGQFSLASLGSCEECEFTSSDGVALRGTYVHRHVVSQRRGIVVFCHEFGGDRHVATAYVARLLEQGFDVFSFDFRNHGDSDRMPSYSPRTWATQHEVRDIAAAINYLRIAGYSDAEGVALMGLSRGGCAAITAASRHEGVWAVITDGEFESRWVTTAYIRRFMPQFVRLAPLLRAVPWCLQVLYGTIVHDAVARRLNHTCIRLKDDIRRLRQPLLMIHGGRDRTIPLELAQRLWRTLRGPARHWICAKGNHNRSIWSEPEKYQRRICRFLKRHAPLPTVASAQYSLAKEHDALAEAGIGFAAERADERSGLPVCV